MKVVVDTNIVISAVLRDRTPEMVLTHVIENPDIEWVASAAILEEYIGVLRRPKFKLPEALLTRWAEVFQEAVTMIDPTQRLEFPRDPKDAKFLDCVIFCQADYFITGDRDFNQAPEQIQSAICSVNQFYSKVVK